MRSARQATGDVRLPVVQLLGAGRGRASSSSRGAPRADARAAALRPAAPSCCPPQSAELETLARLWQRETRSLPVALYLDASRSTRAATEAQPSPVSRFLARTGGVLLLDTRDVWPGLRGTVVRVDVAKPTPAEQQAGCGTRSWAIAPPDDAHAPRRPVQPQPDRDRRRSPGAAPTPTTSATARRRGSGTRASRPPPAPGRAGPAPRAEGDLGRPRAARAGAAPALARSRPGRAARDGLRRLGLRPAHEPRPRHQRAVRRRERHGQDDGRRGARQRAARSTSTASTSRPSSASTSARPRRTCGGSSTRPRAAARSSSSTRRTRSSASAARSRTATTATPTSRSTTCCSAWRPTAAWRSSPPT